MIDIHAHILPGIDDGAADLTDGVLMAELAAEGGTTAIIATPHFNLPGGIYGTDPKNREEYIASIKSAKQALEEELLRRGVKLELYLGMEFFARQGAGKMIEAGDIIPMPDGKHYMLEFDPETSWKSAASVIREAVHAGAKPIVAHPERYACIQEDILRAQLWHELGCEFQINPEGLLGKAQPVICETASMLLEEGLVDYVASDCHDPYTRTPFLGQVYNYIRDNKGEECARRLLVDNPGALLVPGRGMER